METETISSDENNPQPGPSTGTVRQIARRSRPNLFGPAGSQPRPFLQPQEQPTAPGAVGRSQQLGLMPNLRLQAPPTRQNLQSRSANANTQPQQPQNQPPEVVVDEDDDVEMLEEVINVPDGENFYQARGQNAHRGRGRGRGRGQRGRGRGRQRRNRQA